MWHQRTRVRIMTKPTSPRTGPTVHAPTRSHLPMLGGAHLHLKSALLEVFVLGLSSQTGCMVGPVVGQYRAYRLHIVESYVQIRIDFLPPYAHIVRLCRSIHTSPLFFPYHVCTPFCSSIAALSYHDASRRPPEARNVILCCGVLNLGTMVFHALHNSCHFKSWCNSSVVWSSCCIVLR
jgi:hypothetical protein